MILDLKPQYKNDYISPANFHRWFGRKKLSPTYDNELFREILKTTQSDSDETFPIVQSFFKGWIGKEIQNINKSNCPERIIKWGSYFYDLHITTLLLNARDDKEIKELTKIRGVKRLSPDHQRVLVHDSKNFGKILIVKGFCFFLDEKVIMDRNTLLMCKDTYVTRFQTLFAMVNRADKEFADDDWKRLEHIYKMGDTILRDSGNEGYNCIKMVEAMSSLRVAELAREFRNLIPEFPAYRNHIYESVEELAQRHQMITELNEYIQKLETPEIVLTVQTLGTPLHRLLGRPAKSP